MEKNRGAGIEYMKTTNVLVTGVGAIIGYGIIKSLRESKFDVHIVGMDIYEDAVGQHWCNKFIQAKYASSPYYIQFLRNVIQREKIDIVFFGTEQEIYRCVEAREELGEDYKKLVLNKAEILKLSQDKWLTREYLLENDMEDLAIPSVIMGSYTEIAAQFGYEFLLKPRSSYASKGIHSVDNEKDFNFYKAGMGDNFMAQKLIGDNEHEYTVGIFGLGDGSYSSYISLQRKLSQEGATAKAVSYDDDRLKQVVQRLCQVMKPVGPTNFQLRMDGSRYFLLEVNPRISSSTSIRMALGHNEAELSIAYFLNGEVLTPKVKKGKATRFIDEVVLLDE